jgi:hypothetical protein
MGRIYLSGFGFKIQTKTIKRERKTILHRTVYCKCVKDEDGKFYADCYLVKDGTPSYVRMEFTDESYVLKGKTSIFGRTPDKHGKIVNFIRSKQHANDFPGIDRVYSALCENQVFKGSVIEKQHKLYFDVKEHIGAYSMYFPLVEIDDKENNNIYDGNSK